MSFLSAADCRPFLEEHNKSFFLFQAKNKKILDDLPHMKSIWDPAYLTMRQSVISDGGQKSRDPEGCGSRNTQTTVKYHLPKHVKPAKPSPKRYQEGENSFVARFRHAECEPNLPDAAESLEFCSAVLGANVRV